MLTLTTTLKDVIEFEKVHFIHFGTITFHTQMLSIIFDKSSDILTKLETIGEKISV